MDIHYRSIGTIHTPFSEPRGTPIQPRRSGGARGTIDLDPALAEGLLDLDGFSHIVVLYHLHRSEGYKLKVVPYLDDTERGVFATRAPRRPNAIGLSVVRLEKIEGNVLHIRDVDMLDGTPLLDLKPYVPTFDETTEFRTGWLEQRSHRADDTEADERFHKREE
jgi:tRNA-Thr(GGU) m(6)t(6)A37 methyltransferase TsaA